MEISSVSSNSIYQHDLQSKFMQWKKAMQSLDKSLNTGDLAAAQQAMASLPSGFLDSLKKPEGQNSNTTSNSSDQISQDFQALQTALQSGDTDAAKKAFTQFKQDLQLARSNGHHRHHHHHQDQETSSVSSTTTSDTTTSDSSSSVANILNVQA